MEFYRRSRQLLPQTSCHGSEEHIQPAPSPAACPSTPQTCRDRHQPGVPPPKLNYQPGARHAWRGLGSEACHAEGSPSSWSQQAPAHLARAKQDPTQTRRYFGQALHMTSQLPPISCLVKHSTPRGTRRREDGNNHLSREPQMLFHPSASTWKISWQGRESIEKRTFPSVQLPSPLCTLTLGQTSKTLLSGVAPHCSDPSVNRGSIKPCSVSLSTAFSAHSKDSWKGVMEEITQQARDKAFWSRTGISALLTQTKIPKLPTAAIILLLRGFISFL